MINIHQLMREDPQFMVYTGNVMDELTGMNSQDWIYLLWKAYQQGLTPTQFLQAWEDGEI